MDCNEAETFVSVLYDGEEVPQEAIRHITACNACTARLQDYARITTEVRLLAAETQNQKTPLIAPVPLPARHSWLTRLGKSVRIPRLALAALGVLVVVSTMGWIRSVGQNSLITSFQCKIKSPISAAGCRVEVGQPDSGILFDGNEGFAWKIEALKIDEKAVSLRLRIKHFTQSLDPDAARQQLERATPQEISYIPGQQLSLAADGGGTVTLTGSVIHRDAFPREESKPAASFLPDADEINIQTPVLIRDGKDFLGFIPSGARFRVEKGSNNGFSIYIPGQGLFFFTIDPLENGIQGTAFMSQIIFQEEGHYYSLFAQTPIMGGEQPRRIWVVHAKDYLPSQHNLGKSADALVSLRQGALPTKLD